MGMLPYTTPDEIKHRWSRKRALGLSLVSLVLLPCFWLGIDFQTLAESGTRRVRSLSGGEGFAQPGQTEKVSRKLIGTIPKPQEPQRECKTGEELPKLVTVQEWVSKRERPRESITLMTQLSADRLPMLENQCRTWNDPLVAIIYVPLFTNFSLGGRPIIPTYRNTTLEDVLRGVDAFHAFMEATAQCALRLELVGQFLDPLNPQEYPINALRNRAIHKATTDLIFMLDVDFVASPNLGLPEPGYRDPAVYKQMADLTAQKKALVLPAFEITNRKQDLTMAQNFARNMVVAGKDAVRQSYLEGKVEVFNIHNPPGHGPTNSTKWIRLSRPVTYRAVYAPRYEPFLVLSRHVAPWCDERFVGYGGNKIAYITQLHGQGFSFHVHPYGFVIHVPHVKTAAASSFVLAKLRGEAEMDELRALVESEVASNNYAPQTVFCDKQQEAAPVEITVGTAGSSI